MNQPNQIRPIHKKESAATESLKEASITPVVLALPENSGLYTLYPNACDKQLGCVLLQEQDDFSSRSVGYLLYNVNGE